MKTYKEYYELNEMAKQSYDNIINKFESLDNDERLRLIWLTMKEQDLDFNQFKTLISKIKN